MSRFSALASLSFAASALCLLAGAPAMAARDEQISARFKAADTNHDGKLTLDEAKGGMPRVAKNFDRIDAAHQGYITLQQILDIASRL